MEIQLAKLWLVPDMKIFIVLFCLGVLVGGCGEKPLTKEESAKVIEKAIR